MFYTMINNSIERSMLLSLLCKPLSMVVSLIYTPVLLHYLDEEAYGIWATILSIVNWINYFDVGIANGVRNILTIHIEQKEELEAKKDVSTAYTTLTCISSIIFLIGSIFILSINDHLFFNTEIDVKPAFEVSFFFICINFVLSLSKIMLYAINKAEKVSIMSLLTQFVNLCGIVILSFMNEGNMLYVAILVGMSGMIVNFCFLIWIWSKHQYLYPTFKMFSKDRLKNIGNIGLKFFLIQVSGMVLYSTDNLIIARLFGPINVTPYQTTYSAFGIVNALYAAALTPLWAQFAIAKERKNYTWIKKTIRRLEKTLLIIGGILLFGCVFYKSIAFMWLQKKLNYDAGLIIMTAVYNFFYIWSSIYVIACNGMGRIDLQLYLSIVGALLNIPLSYFFGYILHMRSTGVLLATVVCVLIAAIPVACDTYKYLNKMCVINEISLIEE